MGTYVLTPEEDRLSRRVQELEATLLFAKTYIKNVDSCTSDDDDKAIAHIESVLTPASNTKAKP